MPQTHIDWLELDNLVRADLKITETLTQLLEREKTALEQRQYDGFDQLLIEKQRALAELQQHANDRSKIRDAAGFADDRAMLDACETAQPEMAARWHQLISGWETCQQLNQINEQVVNRTRTVVGRVLDILQGRPEQIRLYDAGGRAQQSGGGRDISQA